MFFSRRRRVAYMKSIGRPHPHPHHLLRHFTVPICPPNPIPENAQPMKNLTLNRVSLLSAINASSRIFQHPRFFSVGVDSVMAAAKNNELTAADLNKKEGEKKKEETKVMPPPPEKPEPGDCCGSGCVRCVWDVYYEELEAYEKLCKTDDSDDASESKSS